MVIVWLLLQDVHPYLATGLAASKFGLNMTHVEAALNVLRNQTLLSLVGFHCHLGSTIRDARVFR